MKSFGDKRSAGRGKMPAYLERKCRRLNPHANVGGLSPEVSVIFCPRRCSK